MRFDLNSGIAVPNHALQRTQAARRCGAVWLEGRRSNERRVARPGPLSLFSLGRERLR